MTKTEQARLVAWRLKILEQAGGGPRRVAWTCRRFGISRKTFYQWRKRFAADGAAGSAIGLERRSPRATAQPVVSKILYLRQHYHFGPSRVADYLKRFHDITIAVSSVHRIW